MFVQILQAPLPHSSSAIYAATSPSAFSLSEDGTAMQDLQIPGSLVVRYWFVNTKEF